MAAGLVQPGEAAMLESKLRSAGTAQGHHDCRGGLKGNAVAVEAVITSAGHHMCERM